MLNMCYSLTMSDNNHTPNSGNDSSKGNEGPEKGEAKEYFVYVDRKRSPRTAPRALDVETIRANQDEMVLPFGEAIRYRRLKLGLTQNEIAEYVGKDRSVINKTEKQSRPPQDSEMIRRLAEILEGTEREIRAGYIPAFFPAHNMMREGAPTYSPEERALASARREVQGSLNTFRDLAPDELLEIAALALETFKDVNRETRQHEGEGQGTSGSGSGT